MFRKTVFLFLVASCCRLFAVVPDEGIVWDFEPDVPIGTLATGDYAKVPCTSGDEAFEMSLTGGVMKWMDNPGPRFEYFDIVGTTVARTFTRCLGGALDCVYGAGGITLPNAVSRLSLTKDFTLESYVRIDPGSPVWSRLIQVRRNDTVNQYGDGPETSFAFVLQQATVAEEGGNVLLQLRTDTQYPAVNRKESGGGFNAAHAQAYVTVGKWFHYAIGYQASTKKLIVWINGDLILQTILPRELQFDKRDDELVFGQKLTGAFGYIRFMPRLLTKEELLPNTTMVLNDRLKEPVRAWWRMEEGVAGAEFSAAGLIHSVNPDWWMCSVYTKMSSLITTYSDDVYSTDRQYLVADGKLLSKRNTRSLHIDGSYFTIEGQRAIETTDFTFEFFYKDDGSDIFATIAQRQRPNVTYVKEDGSTVSATAMATWFITRSTEALRIRVDSIPEEGVEPANGRNWNQSADGKTPINDGKWHHVALTYVQETKTFKLYVDYKLDASLVSAYPIPSVNGPLIIGMNNWKANRAGRYWVDEVRYISEAREPSRFMRFASSFGTSFTLR